MVTVTEQAAKQIHRLLSEQGWEGYGLRFGLQDGGCSGYTYMLEFEPEADEDDHVIEAYGVKVFVSPLHVPFIHGSTIRWKDELMETGFDVHNPNVKRSCGCGVSVEF